MWEFMVIWNRDAEVTYALEQAVVYLRCVQSAALQHGIRYLLLVIIVQFEFYYTSSVL